MHLQLFLRASDQEKFRLVVCIHREHPKVHLGAFSLPTISGRQRERDHNLFRERKLKPREGM